MGIDKTGSLPMEFYTAEPTLDNYWRAVILFGRNVASYKFALAKSLIDLTDTDTDLISLDQLALPFSKHICAHLENSDRQTTSASSRFLTECRKFNKGDISQASLQAATTKMGFVNVIDAFHNVNNNEIPERFFVDERRMSNGIRLTDNFYRLFKDNKNASLSQETEARWRLVETAWTHGLSTNLISVQYDPEKAILFSNRVARRVDITSCRDALNGYQKGRCFYSYKPISIQSGTDDLADVDHFFPHILKSDNVIPHIDGVWNLVLSSQACNRGSGGKFAKLPSLTLLSRLHKRNEYLISSHHPLRETLIQQTGKNEFDRKAFLQKCYNHAKTILLHTWEPSPEADASY
jgi:ASC-1-like (ASCH) protein